MEKVFDSEFFAKLNTLRLSLKLRLAAGMNGGRKSNAKGNSVEFSDFREYILGDDIRRIDWNAYGRFDKLYVKLFMEEKEGIFNIFVDTSKSMDFGENNKAVCALQLAGALAYTVLQNSDRCYLNVMQQNSILSTKGLTGAQAFPKALDFLETVEFGGNGDMLSSLMHKQMKQRGVSVVISDLYTDRFEEVLKYLQYKKQEIIVIQVLAEEEENPEFDGTVNLLDSETANGMRMTMSSALLRDYRRNFDLFIKRTDALCRKYSAKYIRVNSSDGLDSILFGTFAKISGR